MPGSLLDARPAVWFAFLIALPVKLGLCLPDSKRQLLQSSWNGVENRQQDCNISDLGRQNPALRRALLVGFNASVHNGPQSMSANDESAAVREFSSKMERVFWRPVPIVSQNFFHNTSTEPACPVAPPSPA